MKNRDRLITSEEEFLEKLDRMIPDETENEEEVFDSLSGIDNDKSMKQNGDKTVINGRISEDTEEDKEKESNSLEENINKKRVRDADEGSPPSKKRIRKSPNKRKVQERKLGKGKNFNEKYKKANKGINCQGESEDEDEDEDKCILCGKTEHLCENEAKIKKDPKRGRIWIWVCKGCSEIMKDEKVMEEIKEIVTREKERKLNTKDVVPGEKIYCCCSCEEKIDKRQSSIECMGCKEWVHLKCSNFKSVKEARKNKNTFVCAKCLNGLDDKKKAEKENGNEKKTEEEDDVEEMESDKISLQTGGVKLYESDLETLKDGEWFNDNILS